MTSFTSGALYWIKQLFISKTIFVKNGCSLSNEHFPIVPGIKNSFEHKSVGKSLFLSSWFCSHSGLFLIEVDQKINLGVTIGYGDSYSDFTFRHFKVFRLLAILHDAAGAVQEHSGKSPGNCYMTGRGPNS